MPKYYHRKTKEIIEVSQEHYDGVLAIQGIYMPYEVIETPEPPKKPTPPKGRTIKEGKQPSKNKPKEIEDNAEQTSTDPS